MVNHVFALSENSVAYSRILTMHSECIVHFFDKQDTNKSLRGVYKK